MRIGILHPGAMGSALALNAAAETCWVGDGRSEATTLRASAAAMTDLGSLTELSRSVDAIISVCPPRAAADVARGVSELGFTGIYVDANAISPRTTRSIAGQFDRFVDGGLIGPPPDPPKTDAKATTRLYLSGIEAEAIAGLFVGSSVETRILGDEPGRASAIKMAFAGWTKGSSALLLSVASYAQSEGVLDDLIDEWRGSIPELPRRLEAVASGVGRKAWRFEGEMGEIAAALAEAGLPEGFHRAAAEVYAGLTHLKDQSGPETVDTIVELLIGRGLYRHLC